MIEEAILNAVVEAINSDGRLSASRMRDGRVLIELEERIGGNSWWNTTHVQLTLKVDPA